MVILKLIVVIDDGDVVIVMVRKEVIEIGFKCFIFWVYGVVVVRGEVVIIVIKVSGRMIVGYE